MKVLFDHRPSHVAPLSATDELETADSVPNKDDRLGLRVIDYRKVNLTFSLNSGRALNQARETLEISRPSTTTSKFSIVISLTMSPTPIIDSHIHLWPQSAANTQGHGWMEPGELLTKQHILSDYNKAAKQNPGDDSDVHVQGVVYVETDRRLEPKDNQTLEQWALQPIEEIRFLRSIVEGEYGERDSAMLQGIVLWAPVDQGLEVFEQWLRHAERVAGEETWSRVKGFRFLLQGITDEAKFYALVRSTGFSRVLKAHASNDRKFCFDVGVDQHSGGVWQLEAIADAMERAHDIVDTSERVTFILSGFYGSQVSGQSSDYLQIISASLISRLDLLPRKRRATSKGGVPASSNFLPSQWST